ncbi:hypothetical protein [Rhizobium ruizarguesonis]|uniref:hypothetical protein n=1 Tax=Rhizobium ruizarguesonis TaxID=2081791 RepID=UPI001CFA33B7|nr:hypothetical protein [Rhizobium ruizarguesonis]UED35940.1 hypothetical protein BSO17_34035 [Rhizobium ruizarguesonis]
MVYRAGGPWSPTVISLLRHLEQGGFTASPRVVSTGFDDRGRETLSFIEGDFVHPGPWFDDALPQLGAIIRQLHVAAAVDIRRSIILAFMEANSAIARIIC